MSGAKDPVSIEELRQLVVLDPDTGALRWRPRGLHHFVSQRDCNRWNNRFAGQLAFTKVGRNGYIVGEMKGRRYMAHRVVWALHHGQWPTHQIDHINNNRSDNRIENLRDVPQTLNQQNRPLNRRNKSGIVGVHSFRNKWLASIRSDNKVKYLGVFESKEEAAAVRKAAEAELGFHPNHGRSLEPLSESSCSLPDSTVSSDLEKELLPAEIGADIERELENVTSSIAEILKARRSELGLSLQVVADRSRLTKTHVWEIEQGRIANPTIRVCLSLCAALSVSLGRLIGAELPRSQLTEQELELIAAHRRIFNGPLPGGGVPQ